MKMYDELASWWPILSAVEDYAEEVAFFLPLLEQAGLPEAPTLLELGSGGGNNAFHLKPRFASVTLSDLSEGMLAVSAALNPDCEHIQGDMRTLRLGRTFDVVFIHDAIEYMTSEDELRAALQTAALHCVPGGLTLIVPDQVRETLAFETDHGGHDGDGRALRFLEWSYDPDPDDDTYVTEYVYMLREGDGPAVIEHDVHLHGVFPRATWLALLREVGFDAQIAHDLFGRDVFFGRRMEG